MKRLLPKIGTPEAEAIIKRWLEGDRETLVRELGYATLNSMHGSIIKYYGIRDNEQPFRPVKTVEPTIEHIPYPDLDVKPFPIPKSMRDEEDMGIVLADWHLAKITDSYNITIARARIDYLLDSIMSIINLHQPIRKLWVFVSGDMVQGENPHQGSKIGEVECSAYEQIHTYAIPILSRFLVSLLQGVALVSVVAVSGNHGKYDRVAPDKTNWDSFLYSGLASALVNQENILIYPPESFYQLTNIRGFRFFLIHGDQVHASQGIPLFAMRRKMQEWYAYVGRFNYGYAGHFHSAAADQVNSLADYTICPPLVTGDSWALEKIGRASEPKQLCFGVHDHYGRTWEYKLHTDEKFLPKKFNEEEGVIPIL